MLQRTLIPSAPLLQALEEQDRFRDASGAEPAPKRWLQHRMPRGDKLGYAISSETGARTVACVRRRSPLEFAYVHPLDAFLLR